METTIKMNAVKQNLSQVLNVISWSEISRIYFGKSNSWLYHKLNGVDGNGKPTSFNEEEKAILKDALLDLSSKIASSANSL